MITTLCVPKNLKYKVWKKQIIDYLLRASVDSYVFHSKHLKVWTENSLIIPYSKILEVKDQTVHTDKRLLPLSYKALSYGSRTCSSHEQAISIMIHYLFNMSGKDHRSELVFHKNRVKSLNKFLKSKYTAKQDHGWEIDELKKAGLIPKRK